jgi:hypothetical protein
LTPIGKGTREDLRRGRGRIEKERGEGGYTLAQYAG